MPIRLPTEFMRYMNKVYIDGIGIYPFASSRQIADYAEAHPGILVAVNAEKILSQTPLTQAIINRNLGYCDGAGPLMLLHKMGHKEAVKVAGCELWLQLVERFHMQKTFYLVGGRQAVIEETVKKLRQQYPGIHIVGHRNGYLPTEADRQALLDDIVAKRPEVVFVAMGSPRQELLMEDMQKIHPAIYQGLGGSFDVYTGHVRRAPQWWVRHHVEWLYRLIHQPSRIRRQAKLVKFAWWIVSGKYPSENVKQTYTAHHG